MVDLYQYIERAIKVHREYHLDRQYVVRDGEIVIVDEFTGRLAEGRKWRDGIHQAIEAKEGVEVTVPTGQAARITVQDFFLRYRYLAGMTGTGTHSAREFRKIYKMRVIAVPTNRPVQRQRSADADLRHRRRQVAGHRRRDLRVAPARPAGADRHPLDRQVGTLVAAAVPARHEHQVLNANEVANEAEIVAQAGQPGKVTVATNMAGRGTDIKLGEGVPELGGLHVIVTEMHDAAASTAS